VSYIALHLCHFSPDDDSDAEGESSEKPFNRVRHKKIINGSSKDTPPFSVASNSTRKVGATYI